MKNKFTIVIIAASLLLVTHSHSQISNLTNTSTSNPEYAGWDGSTVSPAVAKDFDLKNLYANKNITFNTNNTGTNGSSTTKMTILGNNGATTGFVGIGIGNPTQLLQVLGGNIDISTNTKAYMIDGVPILWHNNNPTSIFFSRYWSFLQQPNSFHSVVGENSNNGRKLFGQLDTQSLDSYLKLYLN